MLTYHWPGTRPIDPLLNLELTEHRKWFPPTQAPGPELCFGYRSFDQPFGYEPAIGPERIGKRGEIPGITLDCEEVDAR